MLIRASRHLVESLQVEMGLSGALMGDTNMFNGVVIKYSEPPEARKVREFSLSWHLILNVRRNRFNEQSTLEVKSL